MQCEKCMHAVLCVCRGSLRHLRHGLVSIYMCRQSMLSSGYLTLLIRVIQEKTKFIDVLVCVCVCLLGLCDLIN